MHTRESPHEVPTADNPARPGTIVLPPTSRLAAELRWQERLLPLMVWMVVGLAIFFFVATLAQLTYLNLTIQREPTLDPRVVELVLEGDAADVSSEFRILALLDASTLERRYHQNNVQLMARVWARYLGFVTGMILALVGAAFVLGKLREAPTEVQAGTSAGSLSLRSTSPGLIMAVLGVTLMITTIVTHHYMRWADSSVYLRMAYPMPGEPVASRPAEQEPAVPVPPENRDQADPDFP